MAGKKSKLSPGWLSEKNKKRYKVKKSKLECDEKTDTSNKNKFKVCSFVKNCGENAKEKKVKEISSRSLTISLDNTHLGM